MQQNHLEKISSYTAKILSSYIVIHVNTDNDNSFSLFDGLLIVLILTFFILPMDDGHGFYLQGSTLYLQYAMCIGLLINTAGRIDLPHVCTLYKLPTKLVCKSRRS